MTLPSSVMGMLAPESRGEGRSGRYILPYIRLVLRAKWAGEGLNKKSTSSVKHRLRPYAHCRSALLHCGQTLASTSVRTAVQTDIIQNLGGDFLNRFGRGRQPGDAFHAHQAFCLGDFHAALLNRGVLAVGTTFIAHFGQAVRMNG